MRSSRRNAGENEAWMDMIVASMFNDRDEPEFYRYFLGWASAIVTQRHCHSHERALQTLTFAKGNPFTLIPPRAPCRHSASLDVCTESDTIYHGKEMLRLSVFISSTSFLFTASHVGINNKF